MTSTTMKVQQVVMFLDAVIHIVNVNINAVEAFDAFALSTPGSFILLHTYLSFLITVFYIQYASEDPACQQTIKMSEREHADDNCFYISFSYNLYTPESIVTLDIRYE